MTALYNEIEPYAAAWLRNLSDAGRIARGSVDARSIAEIDAADLVGVRQFHTFAGVGVWSHALRLAGWPDDRPVWTGSCPCQPFSAAGKRGGFDDERHLWPAWFRLIRECRPPVIFGEQVASRDGLAWLDAVYADLEGAGYAVGAVDLCAAGVGAPHIRQRLFFVAERVADAQHALGRAVSKHRQDGHNGPDCGRAEAHGFAGTRSKVCGLEHGAGNGREPRGSGTDRRGSLSRCGAIGLADDDEAGCYRVSAPRVHGRWERTRGSDTAEGGADGTRRYDADGRGTYGRPGPTNGYWRDADWLFCRDGKWRPVEPGSFPLAHGAPARVGRLRGFGNAIVAQAAATFVGAFMDAAGGARCP